MDTIAELVVFALTWFGIMALIGIICAAVSRWGKKRNSDKTTKDQNESLDD